MMTHFVRLDKNNTVDSTSTVLNEECNIEVPATVQCGWTWNGTSFDPPVIAKQWVNAQAFLEEFTMYERGLIALSTNLDIAALRLTFSGWLSEIHADNDLLVQARSFLVSEGILTEDRAQAIFG